MSDDKGIVSAIASVVPAKDVYEDLAQPATREVGKAVGQLGSLLNDVLRPIRTAQLSWNTLFDRLDGWLKEKLSDVPPENLVSPAPNVVGGVATGLLFVENEEILRDMFVQLLANAMTQETRTLAHPAFAEFIKQMTSLDARVVRAFARHRDIATLTVRDHDGSEDEDPAPEGGSHEVTDDDRVTWRGLSDVEWTDLLDDPPDSGWTRETRFTRFDVPQSAPPAADLAAALGNLERLGLVKSQSELALTEPGDYIKIAKCERAVLVYERIEKSGRLPGVHRGVISTTELGRRFMRACLPRVPKAKKG